MQKFLQVNDSDLFLWPASGTVSEDSSIGQSGRKQKPAPGLTLMRVDNQSSLIALLQAAELPAALLEDTGAAHFDAPVLDRAALVSCVDLDVTMWVSPFKPRDRAHDSDLLGHVEHGEGVVRQGRNHQQDSHR